MIENPEKLSQQVDNLGETIGLQMSALRNQMIGIASRRLILEVFLTFRTDVAPINGAYDCDGSEYSKDDFDGENNPYDMLVAGKAPTCTYDEYATYLSDQGGSCGFFALDTTNKKFKVPTINHMLQPTKLASEIASFVHSGLPNITALGSESDTMYVTPWASSASEKNGYANGAVKLVSATNEEYTSPTAWASGTAARRPYRLDFNASWCNSIYGNIPDSSHQVQPPAIKVRAMVQLANVGEEISIQKYSDQLNAVVSQANTDLQSAVSTANSDFNSTVTLAKTELSDTVTSAKSELSDYVSSAKQDVSDATESITSAKTEIQTLSSDTITKITNQKTLALNSIEDERTGLLSDITTAKNNAVSEITSTASSAQTTIDSSVSQAQTYASNASESASSASTSATNAQTSETNASTYASNASTSATNAKTSEENAKASETATLQNETLLQGYVDSASTSASNAKTSEDNAKTYADNASSALAQMDIASILLLAHPVGSYYWSSESTDPSTLFGGTWEQITDKFVYAAGTKAVNATGGEETHTLVSSEVPSHTHTRGTMNITGTVGPMDDMSGNVSGAFYNAGSYAYDATSSGSGGGWTLGFSAANNWSGETSSAGGDGSHNNMPPYIVAYCWRRTA